MTYSFLAEFVSFEPIEGMPTVGFSETPFGDGLYLILQESEDETELDQRLGLDVEYVEVSDKLCGAYKACRYTQVAQQRVLNFGGSAKLLIYIGLAKVESKKFRLVSC